jgi:photosystem II stability/assembly factor-like uncharacterized protein
VPAQTIHGSVAGPNELRLEREAGVALDFVTPARGFLATRGGELRRTDDRGRTWKLVATGPRFVSLSFLSPIAGFGLTAKGRVAATRDAGRSWRILHSFGGLSEDGPFQGAIKFVDAEHGWAAPSGYVYRTLDGGATWRRLRFQCSFALGGFSFVDASNGFLICGGQPATIEQEKDLYVTADGGESWRRRACAHVFGRKCPGNLTESGYASGLAFRDARTGLLLTGRGGIARTLDGGVRWSESLLTDDVDTVLSTSWASSRTIYALTLVGGAVLRSDDAGRRWHQVYPHSPPPPTGAISFASPMRGIGVVAARLLAPAGIEATSDGGRTWRQVAAIHLLDSQLVRVSASVVWAVGVRELLSGGARYFLVRSSDDRRHWRRMPTPPGLDAPALSFATPRVGYLSDFSKRFFRTDNGGRSWRRIASRRDLRGAVFVSAREGLLAGDRGLLRTDDGGRSWKQVQVRPRMRFDELAVLDPRHWWLRGFTCPNAGKSIGPALGGFSKPAPCGGNPYLLRTADGGRRWTAIRFKTAPPSALSFVTPMIGYGVGDGGLYRTTDGGRTWRFVYA